MKDPQWIYGDDIDPEKKEPDELDEPPDVDEEALMWYAVEQYEKERWRKS